MDRSVLITAVALAALFALLFGWRWARTAPPEAIVMPPTPVVAIVVKPEPVPAAIEAVGTLQSVREVMLAPETDGRIVAIRFEGGSRVTAGAPIVELFDAPERADRAAAQTRADLARSQLERSKALAFKGAESTQLLDQRQAELDQALAEVQQLNARITQKVVRAPFTGHLGIRRVNPGQYVDAGAPIATLTALDELYINFAVPQQELAKVKIGGSVEVSADAWPDRAFVGYINAVDPVIRVETRNLTVQALLQNPDALLRPGMFVTVRMVLPPEEDMIVLPATAIQTSASGASVMRVRDVNHLSEGTAELVPVQMGRRVGERVVVQGLSAGDLVVSEGQLRVFPGTRVVLARILSPQAS